MSASDRERALVDRLVADARPVRRLWSPGARLVLWLVLAAVVLSVPAGRVLREDVSLRLRDPAFVFEQGLLLLAGVLLGLEAFRAAVPGRAHGSATTIAGWSALLLAILWMLRAPVHGAWTLDAFLAIGRPCLRRAFVWAVVPWAGLLVALRRGVPLEGRRAGLLAGAATWALVCAALRVCCQTDEFLHLGTFHAFPLIAGALLSAVLGPAVFAGSRAQ